MHLNSLPDHMYQAGGTSMTPR